MQAVLAPLTQHLGDRMIAQKNNNNKGYSVAPFPARQSLSVSFRPVGQGTAAHLPFRVCPPFSFPALSSSSVNSPGRSMAVRDYDLISKRVP